MAKFLSKEWLEALTAALAAHEGFTSAIAGVDLSLQFEVPDAPEGTEAIYHVIIGGGMAKAGPGPAEAPDVTITHSYDTAAAISKGELNTQMAFMTGKIKVAGNMGKLMMNQAMLSQYANASAEVAVEY